MRQKREMLRLNLVQCMSNRTIGKIFGVSHNTVGNLVRAAKRAELDWAQIETLDDTQLEQKLFSERRIKNRNTARPLPDMLAIHTEMQRDNMTLYLLWEEYRLRENNGYRYSQFCHHYRQFRNTLRISMRQVHKAGEKMFVDFSGKRPKIVNPDTGETTYVELFVAVLGASNFTYCEAIPSQTIPYWIKANVNALKYFAGVPKIIVPDNLKSAVSKPDLYEPKIQINYQQFAQHFGVAIVPARVRRPKDKPKVEGAVLLVQRWILLRLRNQTFFSIADLNIEIRKLLEDLNNRPFKKIPGCRRTRYDEIDRPALSPLPAQEFEYSQIRRVLVGPDYHVEHLGHYYSVPYTLIREKIELRILSDVIEILFSGKRVAIQKICNIVGEKTTLTEHMPAQHVHFQMWTPDTIREWGKKVGPFSTQFIHYHLVERGEPYAGQKTCVGLINLKNKFELNRIEMACRRACAIKVLTLKSVKSILQSGTESLPLPHVESSEEKIVQQPHKNIRGANYYQ
ncbi:IS21 family transposase [Undibacterium sp. JH2W]|uniref:IS21 family transposase n=1 Tax=Undibacterium sp. JH2W TaxID=3413037 RepID=UPI003BEFC605